MQVKLSVSARNDYRKIAAYLVEACPEITDKTLSSIKFNLERLADYPLIGRKIGRYRKFQVVGTPYVIYYHLSGDVLLVARIFHEKQNR